MKFCTNAACTMASPCETCMRGAQLFTGALTKLEAVITKAIVKACVAAEIDRAQGEAFWKVYGIARKEGLTKAIQEIFSEAQTNELPTLPAPAAPAATDAPALPPSTEPAPEAPPAEGMPEAPDSAPTQPEVPHPRGAHVKRARLKAKVRAKIVRDAKNGAADELNGTNVPHVAAAMATQEPVIVEGVADAGIKGRDS